MKKMIVSNRYDDLLKEKEDYDKSMENYKEIHKQESKAYNQAIKDVTDPVKDYIEKMLAKYTLLDFEIITDISVYKGRGIEARINCNERRKFESTSSLSWSFDVRIDKDGNVVKETGSWSGLQATTEEQIRSLKQTVGAIEDLNNIDWATLLDKVLPEYDDYIKTKRPETRYFDKELEEARIEEAIGKPIWFGINQNQHSSYIKLTGSTEKFYRAEIVYKWDADRLIKDGLDGKELDEALMERSQSIRIRKDNVIDNISFIDAIAC